MKRLLVVLVSFLCSLQVFSQERVYTFNSLDGLEDKDGNTHLFYRKYYLYHAGVNHSEENGIYRYDVTKNKDTIIAADYWHYNPGTEWNQSVNDISFFDGNPYKYIFCGDKGSLEPYAYIFKSDSGFRFGSSFLFINRIEVSKQNSQRVFASTEDGTIISSDGGLTWPAYELPGGFSSSKNFFLVSTFPSDDKIMLGLKGNHLVKSLDTGNTFVEVDTAGWNSSSRFYYDMDNVHIFGISNGYNGYSFISASDKNGDAFSWKKIWESDRKIFISIDQSLVGPSLYLADGKNIFLSHDYGKTFSHYRKFDRSIVGIYKKPGSNILYAATKYNLYEITSNETKIIKSLPISPETLSYYPLAVGNKWNFNIFRREYLTIGYKDDNGIMTREIIGDTLLPNGKRYFIIKQKESLFSPTWNSNNFLERIDSTTGKVFRYDSVYNTPQDFLIDDLTAELGDTLELYRYHEGNNPDVIYEGNDIKYFDNQILNRKIYRFPNSLSYSSYSMTKGIGLDSLAAGFDLGYTNWWLKGCVISGKVMGDTSLVVGLKNENNDAPTEFSLAQNYPNPFNPETIISYQLAVTSKVSLKVYDILGNEVAILVNEEKPAGKYLVKFKGSNLASGVYFYKLTAGDFSQSKKFVLIK
ncbi:MAG: T9SS type A sorting domain-containing protein [Ignavibacteriaceae bacterium]|nr:T9SS type A sorting domain-containing protein [Ignavibacteriaceae bacterium]